MPTSPPKSHPPPDPPPRPAPMLMPVVQGTTDDHALSELARFADVARHGGFAAAERATGVPRSRLSRHVAALEARLGVRLIQRTTRRFTVTEIGTQVLRHAQAMLEQAAEAQALARAHALEPAGRLRVSCPPALLQLAVGPMLSTFLSAWPRVSLDVEATNRNVDLWSEAIDLALRVRLLPLRDDAETVVRTLAPSPHVLVAAPSLFTNRAPPAEPAELAGGPALSLGNAPGAALWTLRAADGRTATVPPSAARLVVDDMAALRCAVQAGVGFAPLPRAWVAGDLAEGRLIELLPDWSLPDGVVQAAFASRRGMASTLRALIDHLADAFADPASWPLAADTRPSRAPSPTVRTANISR